MNCFPLFGALLDTKVLRHNDSKLLKVLIWCLLKANPKDEMVTIAGKQYKLSVGQFITGQYVAEDELGMAGKTVYLKLRALKGLDILSTKVVKKFTLVTVLHYDTYRKLTVEDFEKDVMFPGNLYLNSLETEPLKLVSELDHDTKKKPAKKPSYPETQPLITFFCNKYKERFNKPYIVSWGKDGAGIRRLLEGGLTFTSITKAVERFLADEDEWLKKNSYSITIFVSRINRYALPDKKKPDHLELEIR